MFGKNKNRNKDLDITKSGILTVLKRVDHPGYNKSLLNLNSIKHFEVVNNQLNINLILHSDSNNQKGLEDKLGKAILNEFKELDRVNLNIEVKSSTKQEKHQVSTILPGVKYTIAVASGKGGVGKSTVAVNLAVALAKDGAKVGLIDADIYGPSIPLMLGINEKPRAYQNEQSVKMIPLENYGIKLMSIGFLVDDSTPVIWRGPMASGAVKQFMTDVAWEDLDYLLFDMPPGTGDIQLTLVQTIPLSGAVIVTTPQEVSLIDARKGLKMFSRVNVPVYGIVENMSYFIAPDTGKRYDIFGEGGGSRLASELNVPFLGEIPIEPRIRIGGDKGIPIVFDAPESEHANKIMEIARNLAKEASSKEKTSKVEIILDNDE